jgi:glucose-1-phosphate thymidylyltransferase
LFHALEAIRDAGIVETGIVTGDTAAEIEAAVGDGSRWGLRVTYLPQEAPLGLAHAVLTAETFVAGEPFLMYLGDNVLLEGVARFVRGFERSRPDAQIFLAQVPEPEHFGVALLAGERVVRLVEKPREHVSDLALVGVYLFDDSILEACRSLQPSARGEYEITEAIQWLIDHGKTVRAEMVSGWWKDTGRPEDLLEANRVLLAAGQRQIDGVVADDVEIEGAVRVAAGAQVRGGSLRGPIVIGEGARIEDAVIGPDVSIEPGCQVERSRIEDSIVMQGCEIRDAGLLRASILGRGVVVDGGGNPGERRLIVGDQGRIDLG